MSRLLPIVVREFTDLALECAKWTLLGAVLFVVMWFLTVGLPRLVAIINGQAPAPVNHSATVHSIPSTASPIIPRGAP
jgi:hypothetical protein